jgi:hypothetical protein
VRQSLAVGGAEAADVATDGEERRPAAGVGEERRGLMPTSASAPAACCRRASKAGSRDSKASKRVTNCATGRVGAGGLAFVLSGRGLLG